MKTPPILKEIVKWEICAYTHEANFIKQFFGTNEDMLFLGRVTWASDVVDFVVVMNDGQHLHRSAPMRKWLKFYAKYGWK